MDKDFHSFRTEKNDNDKVKMRGGESNRVMLNQRVLGDMEIS
jgi:hypothetical protein